MAAAWALDRFEEHATALLQDCNADGEESLAEFIRQQVAAVRQPATDVALSFLQGAQQGLPPDQTILKGTLDIAHALTQIAKSMLLNVVDRLNSVAFYSITSYNLTSDVAFTSWLATLSNFPSVVPVDVRRSTLEGQRWDRRQCRHVHGVVSA